MAISLDYSLKPSGKSLLLKILHTLVTGHENNKCLLTRKLLLPWLGFIVQKCAQQATEGENHPQAYPVVSPVSCNQGPMGAGRHECLESSPNSILGWELGVLIHEIVGIFSLTVTVSKQDTKVITKQSPKKDTGRACEGQGLMAVS